MHLNIAQNIWVYSTLTPQVGRRVIFTIPYESFDTVTQLNCLHFGGYFACNFLQHFHCHHFVDFFLVIFSLWVLTFSPRLNAFNLGQEIWCTFRFCWCSSKWQIFSCRLGRCCGYRNIEIIRLFWAERLWWRQTLPLCHTSSDRHPREEVVKEERALTHPPPPPPYTVWSLKESIFARLALVLLLYQLRRRFESHSFC